jgi:hypothetical protein
MIEYVKISGEYFLLSFQKNFFQAQKAYWGAKRGEKSL